MHAAPDRPLSVAAPYPKSTALDALNGCGILVDYRLGERISRFDGAQDYWYRVVMGVARCCFWLPNGRRQIIDLLLPGDFFAIARNEQDCLWVEAVVDGTAVMLYPRRHAEQLVDANPGAARAIRDMAFHTIARSHQQLLLRGRPTATAKVGWFLINLEGRLASAGRSNEVVLPMSRYDIADYLALSVETVSRALTSLRERQVISFSGSRRLRILDRMALEREERRDAR
jgi:CRP/FNR family transcriptional regulator, nitrogen fixation regulation protein